MEICRVMLYSHAIGLRAGAPMRPTSVTISDPNAHSERGNVGQVGADSAFLNNLKQLASESSFRWMRLERQEWMVRSGNVTPDPQVEQLSLPIERRAELASLCGLHHASAQTLEKEVIYWLLFWWRHAETRTRGPGSRLWSPSRKQRNVFEWPLMVSTHASGKHCGHIAVRGGLLRMPPSMRSSSNY